MRLRLPLLLIILLALTGSSLIAQESPSHFDRAFFQRVVDFTNGNHLYADRADADEAFVGAAEEALKAVPETTFLLHRDYIEEFKASGLTGTNTEINPEGSYVLFQLDRNGKQRHRDVTPTTKKRSGEESITPLRYWKKSGFSKADLYIVIDYVEKRQTVSSQEVLILTLNGFLKAYDPHSKIIEMSNRRTESDGKVGVGLLLRQEATTGGIIIVDVFPGSSSMEKGLRVDDSIVAVDDRPISSLALPEVVALLRGPLESKVNVTVERNRQRLSFQIVRKNTPLRAVESQVFADGIGSIRLRSFLWDRDTDRPVHAFQRELANLQAKGMKALILDLRGNQGGDLQESIDLAGLFLKENQTVVRIKSRHDDSVPMPSRYGVVPADMPVVVLVDAMSYGAAEIVASALQSHDRALILGEQSFGGGSVQSLRLLGSLIVKLTTSRYLTANGGSIHLHGVKPDIAVSPELNGSFPRTMREKDLWHHIPPLEQDDPRPEHIARMKALAERSRTTLQNLEPVLKKRRADGERVDLQLERCLAIFRESLRNQ